MVCIVEQVGTEHFSPSSEFLTYQMLCDSMMVVHFFNFKKKLSKFFLMVILA